MPNEEEHGGAAKLPIAVLPNTDEVHKITVIAVPRSGYTLTLPEQDKFLMTREQLRDELGMLMGGRVAEEIVAGDVTTGAGNDIERATKVARQMVTEYGMSDVIGPRTLGVKQGEVFLGRDWAATPDYSDAVAFEIDSEVRQLIDEAHDVALDILTQHRAKLDESRGAAGGEGNARSRCRGGVLRRHPQARATLRRGPRRGTRGVASGTPHAASRRPRLTGHAAVSDRWATFDCYGTLIDWHGGVGRRRSRACGPTPMSPRSWRRTTESSRRSRRTRHPLSRGDGRNAGAGRRRGASGAA